jgi:uncharacterized membrane protein
MDSTNAALQLFVFLGLPLFAWWACKRSRLLALLSPVMVVYGGGILFGNLARLGTEAEAFAQSVAGVSVMLSISLLMISADLKHWLRLAPITLLASSLAIATVVVLASTLAPVFASHIDDVWKVAGMLAALYTGSTVNMTAVATALDVDPITYGVVLSSDVVIGGSYLAFLFVAGGRVFGWFLTPFQRTPEGVDRLEELPRPTIAGVAKSLLLAGVILGASVGLSKLAPAGTGEPFIILAVTTLGILLSFVPRLRRTEGAYETGDYLLLVFSGAVGSLATWDRLEAAAPALFVYALALGAGAVSIHALLCRLCRVDRDTTIITLVAAFYEPPFIGPVASALGNREIVVSGITAGLLGMALANYLGLAVAYGVKALL